MSSVYSSGGCWVVGSLQSRVAVQSCKEKVPGFLDWASSGAAPPVELWPWGRWLCSRQLALSFSLKVSVRENGVDTASSQSSPPVSGSRQPREARSPKVYGAAGSVSLNFSVGKILTIICPHTSPFCSTEEEKWLQSFYKFKQDI